MATAERPNGQQSNGVPKRGHESADPILSPAAMCRDADISKATWQRNWRHKLPIIRLSAKRIGCRQSNWRAALDARTEDGA